MTRNSSADPPEGSPANPIRLRRTKRILDRYYEGRRLPSPVEGHLDLLGIREGERGTGRVLLECNTSSLRFLLVIPKATPEERAQVKEAEKEGEDPLCPRHGSRQRLTRSAKGWLCPLCGVYYGEIS